MDSAETQHYLRFSSTSQAYQSVLFGIVVWDWLSSAKSEYRYIWRARRSLTKYLYFSARYVCLILTALVFSLHFVQKSLSACDSLVKFNCIALTVIMLTSTAVLTQRAYVLSGRNKAVLAALLAAMIATLVLGCVHAIHGIEAERSAMFEGRGYCHVSTRHGMTALSAVFFGIPILANTFATAVVIYHAIKSLPKGTDLRNLLLVDGVLFLVGIDTIGLVQLIFFLETINQMLMMLNAAALLALTSVFCCRFILHIRAKSASVSRKTSENLAGLQVDWRDGFGKPLEFNSTPISEKHSNRPSVWRSASSKFRRGSASCGSTTVKDSGIHFYSTDSGRESASTISLHFPRPALVRDPVSASGGITVVQDVHQQIEEMTQSELAWERAHPVDEFYPGGGNARPLY